LDFGFLNNPLSNKINYKAISLLPDTRPLNFYSKQTSNLNNDGQKSRNSKKRKTNGILAD